MLLPQGQCPVCRKFYAIVGKEMFRRLRKHPPRTETPCPGSGRRPVPVVECIDARDLLAQMPDKSVDHVITDPPYDEETHSKQRRGVTGYKERKGRGAQIARARALGFAPLNVSDRRHYASEFARLARRWVIVFSSHEMSTAWRADLELGGLDFVRYGVWLKQGSTPQFTGDRPATGHEVIVIAHQPGRKRWNGGGKHGVWTCPIVLNRSHAEPRLHTTQKPLKLLIDLVVDFTDEGDSILDPFAGSGTTLVAGRKTGRNVAGGERLPHYASVAESRVRRAREQLTMGL